MRPPTSYLLPRSSSSAFTLVEVIVGAAVFLIVALAAYNAYIGLFRLIDLSQYKVLAVNLANEQFEIARNMPYADVGIVGGIPKGKLINVQTLTRGGVPFVVTTTVRNLDLAFDGTIGGSPNDLSPADNKLLDITVSCDSCRNMKPVSLTGQIAPKNLETASANGALFVRVFDANGQPVQGANVNVTNVATTTTIVINDVSDANGMLQLVDVPPGNNAYRITVTKQGYSTDRTYPIGAQANPDPINPDATVLLQQVTLASFVIDRLSSLTVSSVTPQCVAVGNFDFTLTGSKRLNKNGIIPVIPKYSAAQVTNGSGQLVLPSVEWDTYTASSTDTAYDIAGLNPLNPVLVNPNAPQQWQMVVVPHNGRSVLVTVKDSATQLPISGAQVTLSKTGYTNTLTTGKGFINQTDWSLGGGQDQYSDVRRYWSDDARTSVTTPVGEIKLKDIFGSYAATGVLESSTFDTGSASNFYSLVWSPSDQPVLAGINSLRFQIATATTTAPELWNFLGPDGTAATYYSTSTTQINAIHTGDQYLRYRAYLATQTATVTPSVSDVAFTFTSSCTPPGQVIFTALSAGMYHVTVAKEGYSTFEYDIPVTAPWMELPVIMTQ